MSRELWIDVGAAPSGNFSPPLILPLPVGEVSIGTVETIVRQQPFVSPGSNLYLATSSPTLHYTPLNNATLPEQGPVMVRVVPLVGIGAGGPAAAAAPAPQFGEQLFRNILQMFNCNKPYNCSGVFGPRWMLMRKPT